MSRRFLHRLLIIVIHFINTLCLFILGGTGEQSFLHGNIPDVNAVIGLIGDHLGNNIPGSLQSLSGILYFLLFINIFGGLLFQRMLRLLFQQIFRQAFQPFFSRHTGPGLPFGPVGTVKVFHHHEGFCRQNFFLQFIRKLSLLLNASDHLFFLFFQIAQIIQSFVKGSQNLIVQGACGLLAVTGDKGNGISLVDQFHSGLHLPFFHLEFFF